MGKPIEYEVLLLGFMMIYLARSSIMELNAFRGKKKDVKIPRLLRTQ